MDRCASAGVGGIGKPTALDRRPSPRRNRAIAGSLWRAVVGVDFKVNRWCALRTPGLLIRSSSSMKNQQLARNVMTCSHLAQSVSCARWDDFNSRWEDVGAPEDSHQRWSPRFQPMMPNKSFIWIGSPKLWVRRIEMQSGPVSYMVHSAQFGAHWRVASEIQTCAKMLFRHFARNFTSTGEIASFAT
jgi:hypothetical protein